MPSENFLEPVKRERLEAVVIDAGRRGGLEHRVVDRLLRRLGDGLEERGDLVVWGRSSMVVAALRRAGVRRTASAVAKARASVAMMTMIEPPVTNTLSVAEGIAGLVEWTLQLATCWSSMKPRWSTCR